MQQSFIRHARRRRRLAAAGVAALLLAVTPAAAEAEGWIPGPAFEIAYPAPVTALAVTPSGAAYAGWLQDGELHLQHAAADGTRGPLRRLSEANEPAPAIDAGDGGAAVAWAHAPGGPSDQLRLTLLRPDGAPRATVDLDPGFAAVTGGPAVAVAPDGDALAVWTSIDNMDPVVRAMRVAADGTAGPPLQLGRSNGGLDAALAPDGTGWITWSDDAGAQQVARIGTDGDVDGTAAALPVGTGITSPALDASAAGAIFTGLDLERVQGVRLPLDGALIGTAFESSTEAADQFGASAVLADDGTVALAWTENGTTPAVTARYSRIAPGAASAPALAVAPEATGWGTAFPRLALADDGSLLAAWMAGGSEAGGPLVARRVAADGTRGIALQTGLRVSRPSGQLPAERIVALASTPDGGGFAATTDVAAADASAIETAVLDVTAPQASATIPGRGLTGEHLMFSATASDRAGVSYWWDFGDGSGARAASATHVYARPGDYAVTLTVTDGAGNVTTIAQSLAIASPPPGAPPPMCQCGPPPRPPVERPPVERPPVTRADAALRLTSAVRRGTAVTVTGTIAASATGKVALVYAQKHGRRTSTARASARIAAGRFRATIRLPRALAKTFRLKPTVTASYAGDAATASGEVARTVTARAARRAARGRRRGVRR